MKAGMYLSLNIFLTASSRLRLLLRAITSKPYTALGRSLDDRYTNCSSHSSFLQSLTRASGGWKDSRKLKRAFSLKYAHRSFCSHWYASAALDQRLFWLLRYSCSVSSLFSHVLRQSVISAGNVSSPL